MDAPIFIHTVYILYIVYYIYKYISLKIMSLTLHPPEMMNDIMQTGLLKELKCIIVQPTLQE